jgi:hypothetical protein
MGYGKTEVEKIGSRARFVHAQRTDEEKHDPQPTGKEDNEDFLHLNDTMSGMRYFFNLGGGILRIGPRRRC